MTRTVTAAYVLLLVGLVALSTRGLLLAATTIVLALGLMVVVWLGAERTGTLGLLVAVLLAPMDDVRPLSAGLATWSDLAFGVSFLLLAPAILRRRGPLPRLYVVGAIWFFVSVLLTSLVTADLVQHISFAIRFAVAVLMLPVALALWAPKPRIIEWLAWAYVVGQSISSLYAAVGLGYEVQGRSFGLTRHPNFLGLGAMVALGLCAFLFTRAATRGQQVLVIAAAAVCGYGLMLSGSRAAIVGVAVVVLLFPLVERSAAAATVLMGGILLGLVTLGSLIAVLGPSSPVARLLTPSDTGANLSDQQREAGLSVYLPEFLHHPVLGVGFTADQYAAHNVYVQMGAAVGLVGLLAFVVIIWSLVKPLFGQGPMHGLGYVAVSYAAIAPITPSIWDRNVWAGLGLAIFAATPGRVRQTAPLEHTSFPETEDAT